MNNVSTSRIAPDYLALVAEATEVLLAGLKADGYEIDTGYAKLRIKDITEGLRTYNETTLRKIIELRNDPHGPIHCYAIESVLFSDHGYCEEYVSNYLHLKHCLPTTDDEGDRLATVTLALASLDYYEGIPQIGSNFEYSQERIDQCTAIITMLNHFEKLFSEGVIEDYPMETKLFDSDMKYGILAFVVENTSDSFIRILDDNQLIDLITSPATDLNALMTLVEERATCDIETLTTLLGIQKANNAAAISRGVL